MVIESLIRSNVTVGLSLAGLCCFGWRKKEVRCQARLREGICDHFSGRSLRKGERHSWLRLVAAKIKR